MLPLNVAGVGDAIGDGLCDGVTGVDGVHATSKTRMRS